jgi:hypothetical protein
MTKYIERGALIEALAMTEFLTMQDAATAIQLATEAPAADVEPVVRGEWIEHYDECECPVCGETWNYCDNDTERFDCCPKCGARLVEYGPEKQK